MTSKERVKAKPSIPGKHLRPRFLSWYYSRGLLELGEGQETFPRLTTDRALTGSDKEGGRAEKLRKPHLQDTGTQILPKTEAESDNIECIYLYHESSPSKKQEQWGRGQSVDREPVGGTSMQGWLKAEREGKSRTPRKTL